MIKMVTPITLDTTESFQDFVRIHTLHNVGISINKYSFRITCLDCMAGI